VEDLIYVNITTLNTETRQMHKQKNMQK